MSQKRRTTTPVILEKQYDLLLWLQKQVPQFPRSHRFVLGDRLLGVGLDMQGLLVEASFTRDKRALLQQAGIKLAQLRYLVRMAKDLEFFSIRQYGYLAEKMEEMGRMIGGWMKQQGAVQGEASR
ncbi:diversity-generating retroelement protein Avd [bacterium endosymbiont of Escarpia laminata]|nr:MAG: diversity-generating retroelement protein Avd [bacterium endosymbiont of Escarpia laminata]